MKRYLTIGYGAVSYLLFLVVILYAIGFVGDFMVPRGVDHGIAAPMWQAVVVNVLLLGLFGAQHSVMAGRGSSGGGRDSYRRRSNAAPTCCFRTPRCC